MECLPRSTTPSNRVDVRELRQRLVISMHLVPESHMVSDIFTKPLYRAKFSCGAATTSSTGRNRRITYMIGKSLPTGVKIKGAPVAASLLVSRHVGSNTFATHRCWK